MNKLVSNIKQFQRDLEQADKTRVNASRTAVKSEGFRLKNQLQKEIRAGSPGGHTFSPLSHIAGIRKYKSKHKTPLYRLAVPVRYRAMYDAKNGMTFQVGYVDPGKGAKLSKSWVRLALLHQEGGRVPVTDDMRHGLIAIGEKVTGPKKNVFFLKKETQHVDIPARPIIEPFWQTHQRVAEQNIIVNFARKMRGERI